MRCFNAFLLALAALLSSAGASAESLAPGRGPGGGLFPYAISTTTLDNGLKVAVVKTPYPGMFALYEIVGVGSRDEVEPGHSGFAHFFEHMMFRGTEAWPADARGSMLAGLGVNEGGFTTDDCTVYWMNGPKDAIPAVIRLEADRFQRLRYSEEDFKTEAKAVLGEYNKTAANPDFFAWEALRKLAFTKHTYRHTTLGFFEDIERMPERYAYSLRFFERFYMPDNVLLLIVGDVDEAAAASGVREAFGGWQGTRAPTKVGKEPPQTSERRAAVPWARPVLPRGQVAGKVPPSATDAEVAALASVLQGYLCSEASPLYRALVLEDPIVEALDCWFRFYRDASLFPLGGRLRESKRHEEALSRVQAALDDIAAGKVDAALLSDVKSHVRYAVLMGLTSADSVARALAVAAGPSLDPHALEKRLEAVGAVDAEALSAFVRAHFSAAQRSFVTLAHEEKGGAR